MDFNIKGRSKIDIYVIDFTMPDGSIVTKTVPVLDSFDDEARNKQIQRFGCLILQENGE